MRILAVFTHRDVAHAPAYPFGLAGLVSWLQAHDHQVSLLYLLHESQTEVALRECFRKEAPDLVLHSSVTSQFPYVRELAERIRARWPGVPQFCGGAHPSLCPKDLAGTAFDGFIRGEGEEVLLNLIEDLSTGNDWRLRPNVVSMDPGGVRCNPLRPFIPDLDLLPWPDRDLFPTPFLVSRDHDTLRFLFSRGCPFRCTYCANHALSALATGIYVRRRSPENACSEIDDVLRRYPATFLAFDDDILTLDKVWLETFLGLFVRHVRRPFACNVRPGTADASVFRLLAQAGCRVVGMGVESGDERIRREVLGRSLSDDQIQRSVDLARKEGLLVKTYNLAGLLGETPEGLCATLRLNQRLRVDDSSLSLFFPYPGTLLGDKVLEGDPACVERAIRERDESPLRDLPLSGEGMGRWKNHFNTMRIKGQEGLPGSGERNLLWAEALTEGTGASAEIWGDLLLPEVLEKGRALQGRVVRLGGRLSGSVRTWLSWMGAGFPSGPTDQGTKRFWRMFVRWWLPMESGAGKTARRPWRGSTRHRGRSGWWRGYAPCTGHSTPCWSRRNAPFSSRWMRT